MIYTQRNRLANLGPLVPSKHEKPTDEESGSLNKQNVAVNLQDCQSGNDINTSSECNLKNVLFNNTNCDRVR